MQAGGTVRGHGGGLLSAGLRGSKAPDTVATVRRVLFVSGKYCHAGGDVPFYRAELPGSAVFRIFTALTRF